MTFSICVRCRKTANTSKFRDCYCISEDTDNDDEQETASGYSGA